MCPNHCYILLYKRCKFGEQSRKCVCILFESRNRHPPIAQLKNVRFNICIFFCNRMTRMEAAVFMGLLIGSLTSNYIFEVTSTQFMFVLSSILIAIALMYLKFAVDESVIGASENNDSTLVNSLVIVPSCMLLIIYFQYVSRPKLQRFSKFVMCTRCFVYYSGNATISTEPLCG